MPRVGVERVPLVVLRSIWGNTMAYSNGKTMVQVQRYEEAREYARTHGYSGIRVEFK